MKRFEQEWSAYLMQVVNKQAGATQIKETKRAFYAGASSVIALLGSLFDPKTGIEPTEEDCEVLETIWKELDDFFKGEMVEVDSKKEAVQ